MQGQGRFAIGYFHQRNALYAQRDREANGDVGDFIVHQEAAAQLACAP
jgi:hypothetical protein